MLAKCFAALGSLLLVAGVAVLAPSADQGGLPGYQPVAGWPQLPEQRKLAAVTAVATDAADRVYVFQRGKQPILVFDKEGKLVRSWGEGLVKTAHGLRVDRDNNIWITDIGHHLVTKFDPQGRTLLTLGKKDQPGEGPDQFNKPTDVAIARSGDIYVADGYGNSRVVQFSKEGKYLRQWGKKGAGPGEFHLPHAICLDGQGRVYVGDRENNRVPVFEPNGKLLAQWKESGAPYGLYLASGGRMLVADGRANSVRVLDGQGKVLGGWGEKGSGPGQFAMPHGICMDSRGVLYVAEVNGQRVQKFVPR